MVRTRNSEHTRAALLAAAAQILLEHGSALSLEAVAKAAGVSKGGLLHHFPSREALLTELALSVATHFHRRLETALEEEVARHGRQPGAWLRAYIRVNFEPDANETSLILALSSLVHGDDYLQRSLELQATYVAAAENDGLPPGRAHAIRLACDGYWMGQFMERTRLSPEQAQALKEELLSWTR
ncbi:AcrR family transcriptional regulator [Deinobacterium chartae]|uniref:AcrR family transcriptional regulator n=1 Tax=Deinobacterium chartae TaxID=521158 RepID=A0A841HTK1_9DEIO|nr:TetR/AcrR family transcriptional regulator [Deinobacterium chartae]MBB6096741.1 AcrR family transcriptional regulator [Deinobacterium chartae]